MAHVAVILPPVLGAERAPRVLGTKKIVLGLPRPTLLLHLFVRLYSRCFKSTVPYRDVIHTAVHVSISDATCHPWLYLHTHTS